MSEDNSPIARMLRTTGRAQFPLVITSGGKVNGDAALSTCEISLNCQNEVRVWHDVNFEEWAAYNDAEDGQVTSDWPIVFKLAGISVSNGIPDQDSALTVCHVFREIIENFPQELDPLGQLIMHNPGVTIPIYINLKAEYEGEEILSGGNSFGIACFVAMLRFLRGEDGVKRHMAYTGAVCGTDIGTATYPVMKLEIKIQIEDMYGLTLYTYWDPAHGLTTGQIRVLEDLLGSSGCVAI